ncbi:hypothetical protein [Leptolyngbya sp. ST-U4]
MFGQYLMSYIAPSMLQENDSGMGFQTPAELLNSIADAGGKSFL